jgi:hypothetical protein
MPESLIRIAETRRRPLGYGEARRTPDSEPETGSGMPETGWLTRKAR